jgi:pyruvate ferredoxin oxidoreductase beta subunit
MEGLQEMRDSEKPTERFAYKEYITDEAKAFLADLDAKRKAKATAQLAAK